MRERVLITGGTGFLGKHLALAMKDSHEVVLAGRNNKQNMLAAERTGCPVIPLDVTRMEAVRDTMIEAKPTIVIHAAATKYVDVAEMQPLECTDVNVLGSQNVARACMEFGVRTLVGISTDKAAPPVRNTYALTKALMERIYCGLNGKSDTRFVCVRFGNLAWSTGSVLPVWKRMLDQSGVIGTTGPEMRRFFIKVEEAVKLILTAVEHIDELQGTVVTRAMKAVQIGDLLELFVRQSGGRWEKIEGRPGEREDEYLVGEMELPYTRKHMFDGIPHYAISFNDRVADIITDPLSSATVERLSEAEMQSILDVAPPDDELW
ncbi:MAG TPA: polysaccharide biosynthesis protein [Sphingomicrobium sp.]|nr:polysaccharide biosynthesis protein [Sphingomicrobium sp.]